MIINISNSVNPEISFSTATCSIILCSFTDFLYTDITMDTNLIINVK